MQHYSCAIAIIKPGVMEFGTVRILSLLTQNLSSHDLHNKQQKYTFHFSTGASDKLHQTRPKARHLQGKEQDIFLIRRSRPLINFKTKGLTD
jgi:hypothetical protein